ncbi:DUF932 domain-containing protein [Thiocystis violascens]|uniref:Phage/plasmid-related protein TIGR03299 n=1 Tax=Thiocystis violascens (strain ATCC 17096 / DSM 198 / 6111) TaxID=765911 RepID=I3Y6L1_THIV6|nr:DUF932 domain-containing protein [Thiocystis violascens]AFL72629.1 phage/plasmid-related protein TIGR03299 [Thiocystis violascens DSM 198]
MFPLVETMADTGQAPWHRLGQALPPKQPIEIWARQAGMDWSIREAPVCFMTERAGALVAITTVSDQKVLYRSDTHAPLSVVSERYQVVQPQEVLAFYRDLAEQSGYELETAGVLKEGKKFWALARTGQETTLKGTDRVKGYLLLATSCDGTLATTATPTTIRTVCNNTLAVAFNGSRSAIKVPHRTRFDAVAVKQPLKVAVSHWDSFLYRIKMLSERKVKNHEALHYFLQVLCQSDQPDRTVNPGLSNERALKTVQRLYEGQGRGADLAAANGTAWGLLCAVTEYVDHEKRARNHGYRLDSAWFGQGALLKQRALDKAWQLAA